MVSSDSSDNNGKKDKGKQRERDDGIQQAEEISSRSSRSSGEGNDITAGGKTSSEAILRDLEATESTNFHSRPDLKTRAMSMGSLSSFAFLPIPLSVERVDPIEAQREIKHLNLISAIALTVGSQVGGGIFSAPVGVTVLFVPIWPVGLYVTRLSKGLETDFAVALISGHCYCSLWKCRRVSTGLARVWSSRLDRCFIVC